MKGGHGAGKEWTFLWEMAEHNGFRHKLWSQTAQI